MPSPGWEVMRMAEKDTSRVVEYVYTKYITLKNGKVLYAADYGLKAFRLPIRRSKPH